MEVQSTEKTPLQEEVQEDTQAPSPATKPQDTTPHQSPPVRANEFSKGKLFVSIWLPLFGHLALSIAITLLVALGVNGYHALAYSEQKRTQANGSYVFRVSDITTLLSAATKIMDYIGAMWTGILGWRCVLVLLEHRGLNISQISEVLGGWPWFKLPRGREWLVALIFAFILPQNFIEPLFSGSVDWNFALDYAPATTVRSGDPTASSTKWYYYNIQGIDRKTSHRPGVAVAFSQDFWASNSTVKTDRKKGTSTFAEASRWSGNMTVLLLLGRQTSVSCKPIYGTAFGNSSFLTKSLPGVFYANANAYDENCMVWGTVYFTAGEIQAPESVYIAPRVIEYHIDTPKANKTISASREAEIVKAIKPSIWTRESLWVMPDAMAQIAVMNTSMLPTWENLNNYTATLIRYAYMSNWDMLHASYEDTDTASLTLRPAEPRLQASVSFGRLFSWFAITLLLPFTGVIFKLLHRSCNREVIADPVAILFTDASRVIEDHHDLTAMSYITKEHKGIEPIRLEGSESHAGGFQLTLKRNSVEREV